MTAELRYVFSSHIDKIGYDYDAGELVVEFRNGKKGAWLDVPVDVFQKVDSAVSIGKAVALYVRGKYEFEYR